MLACQRGALNLFWVGIASALFAGVAMAALFSLRYERNLFAEGAARVRALAVTSGAAALRTVQPDAPLRKCVIDGRTVVSNSDCKDSNPSTRTIAIHDTRGVEAPKAAPVVEPVPGSTPAIDRMIEKQLR